MPADDSSWPSAAARRHGKCCGPWRANACHGTPCKSCRSMKRGRAPPGDPDRNLTHLRESLLSHAPLKAEQIHAMPVESPDLEAAAGTYARLLREIAGSPPVLDLVHLGLGPDGHTASLVPGDPVLNVMDADVAITGIYQGRRRMTLTYPIINRHGEFCGWPPAKRKPTCCCGCATAIVDSVGQNQPEAGNRAGRPCRGRENGTATGMTWRCGWRHLSS